MRKLPTLVTSPILGKDYKNFTNSNKSDRNNFDLSQIKKKTRSFCKFQEKKSPKSEEMVRSLCQAIKKSPKNSNPRCEIGEDEKSEENVMKHVLI